MSATVRRALRVLFLTIIVLSAGAVGQSFVQATASPTAEGSTTPDTATETATGGTENSSGETTGTTDDGTPTATPVPQSRGLTEIDVESRFEAAKDGSRPAENWSAQRVRKASGQRGLTVVATQGFYVSGQTAEIAAITPNGTVVHFNDSYRVYFDVDPVPGERYTVEYVAARQFPESECTQFESDRCTRNVVNRVNLTTGEQETVYAEMTPRIYSARWHDIDRINETHLVVADIINDSVYTVDTRDNSIVWEWKASDVYTRDQGGKSGDWTHINDVEVLPDGRIMASLRNMDSVVFLNQSSGEWVMDESWTLGEDGDHETLFEQHNPDYIPKEQGGPAVLVGDSENTRIVEYQRVDGEWIQTWSWRDVRLQWPRDADRLPNGNTLIVDSNGNRIVELDENDDIVWSADMGMPYDVERIGTGDESSGGPAARLRDQAPLRTPTPTETNGTTNNSGETSDERAGPAEPVEPVDPDASAESGTTAVDQFWFTLKGAIPSHISNGLLYASPPWVLFTDIAFGALFLLVGLTWASSEFYWSRFTLRGLAGAAFQRARSATGRIRRRQ